MTDDEYFAFQAELLAKVGKRELTDEHYERAIGYPWQRPPGSCLVTEKGVQGLADMPVSRRDQLMEQIASPSSDRIALLAYGANSSPERLSLKLALLPEGDREALILAGELEDYDIGVAAQPPVFSSMPATIVPSAGTAARIAVLLLTQAQFTALWWTELSYKVGALSDVRIRLDLLESPISRAICFVSRYGAFQVDGAPVAMAAIDAQRRRFTAMTQLELLDAGARMTLGEEKQARDLVKAAYENPAEFMTNHLATYRVASEGFASDHWGELPT